MGEDYSDVKFDRGTAKKDRGKIEQNKIDILCLKSILLCACIWVNSHEKYLSGEMFHQRHFFSN